MRPRPLIALLFLCCTASILAQTRDQSAADASVAPSAPQAKPVAPTPATAAITGTVFCNDTRRPARGAVVMAQLVPRTGHVSVNFDGGMARVGMDGTYTLQHLRPGDYSVFALLPGYISTLDDLPLNLNGTENAEVRARLVLNGIVSVNNNETARMDITIQRGASISGRVLYDDGAPATQVIINLEDVNARPPAHKPAQPDNALLDMPNVDTGALVRNIFLHQAQGTDDQGNFRISGIKPGTYRVVALVPTEGLSQQDEVASIIFGGLGNPHAVRIYSGDTFHKNNAKTYDLRAGEETTGIEITVPVYAFHRVEGHVTTLDDRPILVAGITLTDSSDDSFVLHAQPTRDGEFIFPAVPAGTYNLAVTGAKLGTLPEGLSDDYQVNPAQLRNVQSFADKTTSVLIKDDDVTDLSIQLQPAATPNQPAATPSAAASSGPD